MDRSHVTGILTKRLEDYMQEATLDLTINEQNIRDKSFLRPAIGAKWLRYGLEENRYVNVLNKKIEDLRLSIKQKLLEKQGQSLENMDPGVGRLISVNAEKLLKKSSIFQELQDQLNQQSDIIRFIEETQKLVAQMGYDIRNSIDVLKLENI